MLTVDVQRDSEDPSPGDAALRAAIDIVMAVADSDPGTPTELSLRIVSQAEIRELNRRYRQRDRVTNVLSFPARLPPDLPFRHLGDVVICADVVRQEAQEQSKSEEAHWAHMLVHGTLHLLGFDHETDSDALEMEGLETQVLARLGWPCPYDIPTPGNTPRTMELVQ